MLEADCRGGKTFRCEEGRDEKWSKERPRAGFHCTQLEPRIQTLNLGRAEYGENLMLKWGELKKGRNFYVTIRRDA
jgi:hypothetical protein